MTPAELAYRSGSTTVEERNQLVMEELDQVYYIAARIRERLPQHIAMEDLVSSGVIGLMEAAQSYRSEHARFKTYAKFRIRGAILDSLRDLDPASRQLRKKSREISQAILQLEAVLGRSPTETEIADYLKITLDELQKTLGELDSVEVIGQQIATNCDQEEWRDLIESAPSRRNDNPFELCASSELKAELAHAISRLSGREQLLISLYYKEELTMKETAAVLGVAESRVSQMHKMVMAKLRADLSHLEGQACQ